MAVSDRSPRAEHTACTRQAIVDAALVRNRLRLDLTAALKARDVVAVAALRSALAAVENAEAVEVAGVAEPEVGNEHVAGSMAGLGAAEVARRVLTSADVQAILNAHVDEQLSAAEQYERLGQPRHAERLRAEADVVLGYLLR